MYFKAKTLMFVNISPSEYNADETQQSLLYASRVKQITNEVVKNIETKEYSKLKEQYRQVCEEFEQFKQKAQKAPTP